MRKFILTIALAILVPASVSAVTLYDVFKGATGKFPTVQDRAPIALEMCGIEKYAGNHDQNIDFLNCLLTPTQSVGGTVTKPNTFSPNTVIYSSQINANYDTLYTLVNGNIDNDNIKASAGIEASKISGTAILATPSSAQTITGTTTMSGTLFVSSTTGIFRVPVMTTTQRNALTNEENGAIIYNSTDGEFQVYEASAWAGITGTGETAIATTVAKGLVEIGTATEMASSTPAGTGSTNAWLVPDSTMTTSSPYTAGKYIAVTESDGKFNQSFIDLADTYTWTGNHTFTASTTLMATTTVNNIDVNGRLEIGNTIANNLVGGSTTDASALHYHSGTVSTGQSSRAINSTGTQAITHSLGVIPSYIQINAMTTGVISDKTLVSSFGTATSTVGQYATYGAIENGTSVVASIGQNASNIIALVDADGASLGIGNLSAVDTTTFTINWTTNPNEGSARVFQWTAFK